MTNGSVETHTELLILPDSPTAKYRVFLGISLLPSTNEEFVAKYPDGFKHQADFTTLPEAIEYHKMLNVKLGLPDPIRIDNKLASMSESVREDAR